MPENAKIRAGRTLGYAPRDPDMYACDNCQGYFYREELRSIRKGYGLCPTCQGEVILLPEELKAELVDLALELGAEIEEDL